MPEPNAAAFKPQWTVEELSTYFVVRDASGQKVTFIYFEDDLEKLHGERVTRVRRIDPASSLQIDVNSTPIRAKSSVTESPKTPSGKVQRFVLHQRA